MSASENMCTNDDFLICLNVSVGDIPLKVMIDTIMDGDLVTGLDVKVGQHTKEKIRNHDYLF